MTTGRSHLIRLAAAAVLFAGCAGAKPVPPSADTTVAPAAAPTTPALDLAKLIARETSPLPTQPVAIDDLKTTGAIEAVAAPKVAAAQGVDKVYTVEASIGSSEAVQCHVYPERVDVGATLSRLFGALSKSAALQAVRPAEIKAVQGYPLVFFEAEYLADLPAGKAFGQLKVAVYQHPQHSLLCLHDEPGYLAAFRRIVEGFATSLKTARDLQPTRFTELQIGTLDGVPGGFEQLTLSADGAKFERIASSWFVTIDPVKLTAEDEATFETLEKDGSLNEARYLASFGGEIATNVEVKRAGKRAYTCKGVDKGQPVDAKIEVKDKLFTQFGARGLLAGLLKAKPAKGKAAAKAAKELKVSTWLPSAEAKSAIEAKYAPVGAEAPRAVSVNLDGHVLKYVLDEAGLPTRTEIPIGEQHVFVLERVVVNGAP